MKAGARDVVASVLSSSEIEREPLDRPTEADCGYVVQTRTYIESEWQTWWNTTADDPTDAALKWDRICGGPWGYSYEYLVVVDLARVVRCHTEVDGEP